MMFNKFIERKRILQGLVEGTLREYLRQIYPDITKTEGQFNHTDAISIMKDMRSELKCRSEDYDDFIIEKDKWDKLQKYTEKSVLYICSSYKGVWTFKSQELPEPIWEIQMHNKTTKFSNNEKISKVVGFYPKELGEDITNLILWK